MEFWKYKRLDESLKDLMRFDGQLEKKLVLPFLR